MESCRKKIFLTLMIFLISLAPAFSRKKNAKSESLPLESQEQNFEPQDEIQTQKPDENALEFASETTKLPSPIKKDKSFFADVSSGILDSVCNGSPASLESAVAELKKIEEKSFQENVLLSVAISMMKILWPSVPFDEPPVEIEGDNAYISAVLSARNGMYDFNTGNSDFLSRALPSLVLALSDTRSDYYAEAEKNLNLCLDEKNGSVFVNYLFALLCRRQARYDEALLHLENAGENLLEVSRISGIYGIQEIDYALAQTYYDTKNYEEAERISESLLSRNSSEKKYIKLCAYASFASGKLEKAELYVNRILQTEPGNGDFLLFRTKILIARKEYIRAVSLLDAYSRIDSSSRDYLFLRFTVQKEWNKNISAATETIQKALELYPDDEEIMLAAAALACENSVSINGFSGEELAEQILLKDPQNYEAQKIKIDSLVQQENWSKAYDESSSFVKNHPDDSDSLFTHVKICLNAEKKNEAWKIASELYAKNPSDENVLQSYIEVLVSTSRRAEASKIIKELLPSASARMKSFLYYERSFLSPSETEIFSDLRSSLASNPRNRDALLRLYRIYFSKKEYRKAQYYLKQVVAISPKDEKILELNRQLDSLIK